MVMIFFILYDLFNNAVKTFLNKNTKTKKSTLTIAHIGPHAFNKMEARSF